MNQIKEFAQKNSWKYQMDNSKGLDGWNNYSSGTNEYSDWIVSVGRNRDSEILEESNFAAALEMLGGESDNVTVQRFGHWGCGWFELIMVNPKSKKHVKIAFEIHNSLKDYPVLDESDYCERELEYQSDYAEGAKKDLASALSKHFGVKNTKKLADIAFQLNIECQNYYGNDSCVDVYDCRKPDKHDIERLKNCIEQMGYSDFWNKSKKFNELKKAVEEYRVIG